ncbi:THA11-like protein [Mya arenaria]|uniref:THA11-like protein n=1 Tax=Mya arenaria TaxID=6604 RepID=A0ABY7EZY1_MYAAR|nr:THA11-like protein [Mya arenaria]
MPTSRCAPGCTQRFTRNSGIHFFRSPEDKDKRLKWQKSLRRRDFKNYLKLLEPSQHDRLCSQHFISGKPSKDPCHPDYSPSVFSFTSPQHPQQTPARVERYKRLHKRRLVLTPLHKDNCPPHSETADIAETLLMLGQDLPHPCDKGTDPGPDPLQRESLIN